MKLMISKAYAMLKIAGDILVDSGAPDEIITGLNMVANEVLAAAKLEAKDAGIEVPPVEHRFDAPEHRKVEADPMRPCPKVLHC